MILYDGIQPDIGRTNFDIGRITSGVKRLSSQGEEIVILISKDGRKSMARLC